MDHKKKGHMKASEESLAAQISELKEDLSDKDLKDVLKSASSIGRVKSLSEYAQDRALSIKRLLQIPKLHPLPSQAQTISDDVTTSTKHTYTVDNMPLLLHHFYCQRLEELIQLRHILLVRWARFAVGVSKVTEELQEFFKLIMEHILQEYNYTLERSRTLSQAVDCVLAKKATPTNLVLEEDMLVYLRWLVYQQHVGKEIECFIRSIQWYPMLHYQEISQSLAASSSPPTHSLPSDKKADGHAPPHQAPPTKSMVSSLLQQQSSHRFLGTSPKRGNQQVGVVLPGLPKLTTSVSDLQPLIHELSTHYSIQGDHMLRTQSDELQLYHRADRRFREIFTSQETVYTLHTYDRSPSDGSKRQQKSKLLFKKPSNWAKFVKIRPRPDPLQIESLTQIRQSVTAVDKFLELSSHCTHLHSLHRVLYALRQHYVFVKHTSTTLTPLSLKGHGGSRDMSLVWKCMYSGVDSRNPLGTEDDADGAIPKVGVAGSADHAHSKGTFDVSSAMKLINNPEGRSVSAKAHSSPNDGYFAFLLLRHLKIREERHSCLNILNYFRSVERTLTINEEGLSLDSSNGEQRPSMTGLLDHHHLFNTPADYIVNQSEFMRYMEVENHDDFYSFEASNQIRVWDQQGVGVVYDSAVQDLSDLEKELLIVASHYLAKCPHKEKSVDSRHHGDLAEDLDTGTYAGVGVDRMAILWDLWREEAKFLHAKMRVINCYLECYHHTSDRGQRTKLAEAITTLLWTRPRFDPTAQYFTGVYREEVKVMGVYEQLLQEMVTAQLDRERLYNQKMCGDIRVSPMVIVENATPPSHGLPHPLVPKQLISLSGDRHLLIHSYLLECAGSLGRLGELPEAVQWSLSETAKTQHVSSVRETLLLHCQLLDTLLSDWRERRVIGSTFTPDLQTHLFSEAIAEDPKVMTELCVTHGNRAAKEAMIKGVPPKEQVVKRLQAWVEMAELTVTRHHLILTCSDTHCLTHLYKQQLAQLDQESYHAHLRCLPFDLSLRLPADKDLDYFVTKARDSDPSGDRCAVSALKLAVNELDEKHVGVFSFRSQEGINKMLSTKGGLESVVVTTTCQLSHRHALLVACQHNHLIVRHTQMPVGGASGGSNMASASFVGALPTSSAIQSELSVTTVKKLKKDFISIQREKTPVRDHMLGQFTRQPSSLQRDQSELTAVKCSLLSQFSAHLTRLLSLVSLRVQIIHHLDDLHRLLNKFSAVKSSFFTLGKLSDPSSLIGQKSGHTSSSSSIGGKLSFERIQQMGGVKDPRQIRARPTLLLDKNGEKLMNLWYLPHFMEVLEMFAHLPLDKARQALERTLCLVSALHVFLLYTCAYVRLGHASSQQVGGAWGGIENIGSQLLQLQSEISRLSNPGNPDEVGRYLWLRCRVAHLAHDITVRHFLRRSLIHKHCYQALQQLENISVPALRQLYPPQPSQLPPPLDTLPDSQNSAMVPRHHFDSTHHPLSITSDHTHLISAYVYSSLAMFNEKELNLAHGELLALSLRLEDVLKTSGLPGSTAEEHTAHPQTSSTHNRLLSSSGQNSHRGQKTSLTTSSISSTPSPRHRRSVTPQTITPHTLPSLTLLTPPLESAALLEKFLFTSYQLERVKEEWGSKMLRVHTIRERRDLVAFEDSYKEKVYNWARMWVAKQQVKELAKIQLEMDSVDAASSVTFMTETTIADHTPSTDLLETSDNLSELALEQAQITHLCEMLDNGLIQETTKQLSRLHHLMLSEQERDHTTLPLDLWKNSAINAKEITGLSRSHVVEDFVRLLESKMSGNRDTVTVTRADLKECLQLLASGVLGREKDCYHLYASYYEALLRSQYNQLYQKNQDIAHYRSLAESNATQTREESLFFMGEHTQDLLLEVTALRKKVRELLKQLTSVTSHTHSQVQHEYSQLVNNLFSATMAIKSRYEEYRGHLYGDMTHSLHEVRQLAADSVRKMKEKLGVQGSGDVAMTTDGACAEDVAMVARLKNEGMKDIQQENAELSKLVIKMRAVHTWNNYKDSVAHHHKMARLEVELDKARIECLELKMKTEQEISSLKQQLQAAQKNLGRVERECEVVKHNFEEERRKKYPSVKKSTKGQESPFRSRGERSRMAKLEQLKHELDTKEKLLKETAEEKKLADRHASAAKNRSTKVTRELKQQLFHERLLKTDAFHQVDELLAQVEEYTLQEGNTLRSSLQATSHTPLVSSTPTVSARGGLGTPTPSGRRPKSVVHGKSGGRGSGNEPLEIRRGSSGETIDLSQEILALKLI